MELSKFNEDRKPYIAIAIFIAKYCNGNVIYGRSILWKKKN